MLLQTIDHRTSGAEWLAERNAPRDLSSDMEHQGMTAAASFEYVLSTPVESTAVLT
jgi:hypothetical protein